MLVMLHSEYYARSDELNGDQKVQVARRVRFTFLSTISSVADQQVPLCKVGRSTSVIRRCGRGWSFTVSSMPEGGESDTHLRTDTNTSQPLTAIMMSSISCISGCSEDVIRESLCHFLGSTTP